MLHVLIVIDNLELLNEVLEHLQTDLPHFHLGKCTYTGTRFSSSCLLQQANSNLQDGNKLYVNEDFLPDIDHVSEGLPCKYPLEEKSTDAGKDSFFLEADVSRVEQAHSNFESIITLPVTNLKSCDTLCQENDSYHNEHFTEMELREIDVLPTKILETDGKANHYMKDSLGDSEAKSIATSPIEASGSIINSFEPSNNGNTHSCVEVEYQDNKDEAMVIQTDECLQCTTAQSIKPRVMSIEIIKVDIPRARNISDHTYILDESLSFDPGENHGQDVDVHRNSADILLSVSMEHQLLGDIISSNGYSKALKSLHSYDLEHPPPISSTVIESSVLHITTYIMEDESSDDNLEKDKDSRATEKKIYRRQRINRITKSQI